jgi:uncharacterized protein (TIGR02611 family)
MATQGPEPPRTRRGATMMERVRARKELHKQRSRVYRAVVGAAGGSLVLVGIVLALPGVPGPGLLVVAIGLALLALEFDRAERLLERVLHRLDDLGESAAKAGPVQKGVVTAITVLAASAVVGALFFWDLPFVPL